MNEIRRVVPDPNEIGRIRAVIERVREARERAGYDLAATFSWDDADEMLSEALHAFNLARELKAHPEFTEFLLVALIARRRRG